MRAPAKTPVSSTVHHSVKIPPYYNKIFYRVVKNMKTKGIFMKINHVRWSVSARPATRKRLLPRAAQAIADTRRRWIPMISRCRKAAKKFIHTGQTICSSSAPRSTRDASRTRCSHLYRPILREMARSPFRWLSSESPTSTMGSSSFAMN